MSRATTAILGVEYPGRPLVGSLACDIYCAEQLRGREAAQKLLDAHNSIRRAFNDTPVDLLDDMTDVPMEGLTHIPLTDVKRDRDPQSGRERVAA